MGAMREYTVEETFTEMPNFFIRENTDIMEGIVQYNIVGYNGGEWYVTILDGVCTVNKGTADDADVIITMNSKDWIDLCYSRINGLDAYTEGKIKVNGNCHAIRGSFS